MASGVISKSSLLRLENLSANFFMVEQTVSENDEQWIYVCRVKENCMVAWRYHGHQFSGGQVVHRASTSFLHSCQSKPSSAKHSPCISEANSCLLSWCSGLPAPHKLISVKILVSATTCDLLKHFFTGISSIDTKAMESHAKCTRSIYMLQWQCFVKFSWGDAVCNLFWQYCGVQSPACPPQSWLLLSCIISRQTCSKPRGGTPI